MEQFSVKHPTREQSYTVSHKHTENRLVHFKERGVLIWKEHQSAFHQYRVLFPKGK